MMEERDYKKTATSLKADASGLLDGDEQARLRYLIEDRMINATWVLRRMPDREKGFLKLRGALWPEMRAEPGAYPREMMSSFEARWQMRIAPKEIDRMQPTLDLLMLLPDPFDRQIVFWSAWHQDGERQTRMPWMKVRRCLGGQISRWTLKRRYEAALQWLSALIALQK